MNRYDIIATGGATGALLCSIDWAKTPLGPMDRWPASASAAVELMVASGFPLGLVLGPDRSNSLFLYNDAFIPFLGQKHPLSMGRCARDVWSEIWDFVEWALRQVWQTGRSVTGKDLLLRVERGEQPEEIHASISFSPIWGNDTVWGALICCIETTRGVIGERRERALRVIAHGLSEARTENDLYGRMGAVLLPLVKDVAFAALYVLDPEERRASRRVVVGLVADAPEFPSEVDLSADADDTWGLGQTVRERRLRLVPSPDVRLSAAAALAGPPRTAAIVPVTCSPQASPVGVLIAGLSPVQAFDDAYATFVRRVGKEIGTALTGVRSLDHAHLRAAALAEFERERTRFLAEITHEFRTLVTLLIGPVEDLLDEVEPLSPVQRTQLQGVRRSAYRVLRYVTALLSFTRVDAGRAAVSFEPTDLAGLTREIARAFEPAAARAGLPLRIDCPPTSEPVLVARDMWEQIVLNLLANALKFTFTGEIEISLRIVAERALLTVRDTGTGIPAEALPHVFERFYRVPNARARSHEGVGIGLALVKSIVELHAGSIQVRSTPGEGTIFTVEIPRGIAASAVRLRDAPAPEAVAQSVAPFVEDALGWLAEEAPAEATRAVEGPQDARRGRVLIAEDNSDMRAYLTRLLGLAHDVEVVPDGAAALALARAHPPDLVLSDVAMPHGNGLDVVRALRADPTTREIPIVLIAARGGEDATIGALGAGADDYLVKPFSGRELRARVRTHLELARARREGAESRLKDVFLGLASHELRTPLTGLKLNVQLCQRELAAQGSPLAARLAGLHRSIDRMTRLVNDMLSVSAITEGKLTIHTTRCDLGRICRDAANELIQVSHRALVLDLPDAPVPVVADADRLGQVVANLLSNAIKYSAPDRPVKLTLRVEGDEEAVVRVEDAGPGIPGDALPHIFDRFYRVPTIGVQSGSYVGLGLGLFLAKAIVEQHGGRIWVESAVGKGSTFAFAIPLAGAMGPTALIS
ncbi:MAG TPA: ATP-binding protein [Polyangium sp.]|nr:ATP-binding protein [Polyangium sp.]